MPEFFDTSQIRDDPGHWDSLAGRVAAHAVRESNLNGMDWLTHSRAGWVAASLLLVAALAFLLLPGADSSTSGLSAEWERALIPADAVARAIMRPESPPSVGVLLLGARGRS